MPKESKEVQKEVTIKTIPTKETHANILTSNKQNNEYHKSIYAKLYEGRRPSRFR